MAVDQTVLFTLIPRAGAVTGDTVPVSIFAAPRLRGGDRLGQFPDWLNWTRQLKDSGMKFEIHCSGQSIEAAIDTAVLRPDLWQELFNERTLVRSHAFDDYTDHGIISYSVREALSAVKGIYQQASVSLALPDPAGQQHEREQGRNRQILGNLTEGLDVHWDGRLAPRWRIVNRARNRTDTFATVLNEFAARALDSEGLIAAPVDPNRVRAVSQDFSVFHHMPTPDRDDHPLALDSENVLDFHQALSSLNSYPELLRALGMVFDLALPTTFVKATPLTAPGTLSVHSTTSGWQTPTRTPELATSYIRADVGTLRLFVPAPRSITDPAAPTAVLGLLDLDPQRFGLAQVDIDGAMHKAIILADTIHNPDPLGNLASGVQPGAAPHPEVFDPGATLPSLRSGGFSLYADRRGSVLFTTLLDAKAFNQALDSNGAQPRPFAAEDLVRGYRLDVWDSHSGKWHSLHRRRGSYRIGTSDFTTRDEEGFAQGAATQPAPGAVPADKDLYVHEAIARWVGWSLSAPRPGKPLSRFADPAKAVPVDGDPAYAVDQPVTPFKMTVTYVPEPGSLTPLRFGRRYRFRARAVDLAGNSLPLGDAFGDEISAVWALPQNPEGFAYLRYEPVGAPLLVLNDQAAVTTPGSALDRIVIRTLNDTPEKDSAAAVLVGAQRHLVPPRTAVEMGERHGMFDDASGALRSDAATWNLIGARDAAELPHAVITVAGKSDSYPIVTEETIDPLPYLPDPFSRGIAVRDIPGAPDAAIGRVPLGAAAGPVAYKSLNDPNPRPGSVTMLPFGDPADWQSLKGIRLALAEPATGQTDLRPTWDPDHRTLTLFLAKGAMTVVPVSSYLQTEDLKEMGVWQWLREYVEALSVLSPRPDPLLLGADVDQIAHVLQRTVEGGHWMLTPPRLVTLVHAVQQPLGRPAFAAVHLSHESVNFGLGLQTASITGRQDPTELAPLTGWRRAGGTETYLLGGLKVHGASTQQVDIVAEWDDPVDNLPDPGPSTQNHKSHVDEIRLSGLAETYLRAGGADFRQNGYYDPEHDQIVFVRSGDTTGEQGAEKEQFVDAAPRHQINDSKHHRVRYTAVATSRFREYFAQDAGMDFTRSSEQVMVDVPASARPLAPSIAFVVPTFGWQRQSDTNMQRSVRFGGGLRVYLHRPWYSSGEGEMLGVTLWSGSTYGGLTPDERVDFKPYITQWGMDPIWDTGALSGWPAYYDFSSDNAFALGVSLEESVPGPDHKGGRVDVVGFPAEYDPVRKLWFADLTINIPTDTYMPFVRLALARYQPHAIDDARISRVVLADFAQLTPTRSALITTDPHHARTVRVTVSGVAPRGPQPSVRAEPLPRQLSARPTQVRVRVQERDPAIAGDLGWRDAPAGAGVVHADFDGRPPALPDVALWTGTVTFAAVPEPGRYRLLIEETEYISADYTIREPEGVVQPGRLIYAEIVPLNADLVQE